MMMRDNSWREGFNTALSWRVADVRHDKETAVLIFRDIWIMIHKDTICGIADAVK